MVAKGDDDIFIQPRMVLATARLLLQLPPQPPDQHATSASINGEGRGSGDRGAGGRGAHRWKEIDRGQHIFAGVFEWCTSSRSKTRAPARAPILRPLAQEALAPQRQKSGRPFGAVRALGCAECIAAVALKS